MPSTKAPQPPNYRSVPWRRPTNSVGGNRAASFPIEPESTCTTLRLTTRIVHTTVSKSFTKAGLGLEQSVHWPRRLTHAARHEQIRKRGGCSEEGAQNKAKSRTFCTIPHSAGTITTMLSSPHIPSCPPDRQQVPAVLVVGSAPLYDRCCSVAQGRACAAPPLT